MRYPNFQEEKKLRKKGYKKVVGLDESGRGTLAAPVVAAAVGLNCKFKHLGLLKEIRDSKKLSPKKREEFYKILTNHSVIEWGTGKAGPKVIDRINILEATKLAMKRAIKNLENKIQRTVLGHSVARKSDRSNKRQNPLVDFLILDGNFSIPIKDIPQKSIIKADEKVFSCSAASVIAKVTRDRMMQRCHKKYPRYGFDRHKGYPTKFHRKMLKKYGPSEIHRKSFKPVKKMLE